MSSKYKISICMMVKDEEKNLKRCLESLKPLMQDKFAEIIIVDTGSGDNTVNIAKQYVDKIYYHKWNNDFSAMRNITISYAKGEWIFIIDADEELQKPIEMINLFKDESIEKYNTITLKINNLTNKHKVNSDVINTSPRLFKNDGSFMYSGSVHNQPVYKKPIFNTDISIIHYGYLLNDKLLMEKKFLRTKALIINELKKNPKNIYYQYQLGVSYDMHGDAYKALIEYRKAYHLLDNQSYENRFNYIYVYSSYAKSAFSNKKFKEVISVSKEGIEIRPDLVDLQYILGIAQMAIGDTEAAINSFKKYIELANNYKNLEISKDLSVSLYNVSEESKSNIYYNLINCYIVTGSYAEAQKYIDFLKDDDNKKIQVLITIYLKLKDYDNLKNYYLSIKKEELISTFTGLLENSLKQYDKDETNNIYRVFSNCNDSYGLFNKIRLSNENDKLIYIKQFLKENDFNTLDLFYSDIFRYLYEDKKSLFNYIKKINSVKLKYITKYLLEKYEESKNVFEELINNQIIRNTDIEGNKVYTSVASVLLIYHLEEYDEIHENYYEMFKKYINCGISYVSELYKLERARIIYKQVNNDEDRFFILMYIINNYISSNDYKQAIKYTIEAAKSYKIMVKYIDIYKNDIFRNIIKEGE